MTRQISKGECTFCHTEYSKSGMTRHLQTCKQRASIEAQTEYHQQAQTTSKLHLLVEEGRYSPTYWMHLDITANTTLATLDQFLRDIWLECCGHLSAFDIAGTRYSVDEARYEWDTDQKSMRVPLGEVLHPGQTCSYQYDFGSTTDLIMKVISEREAPADGKAIHVLARNALWFYPCDECGAPSILVCARCTSKNSGWLCKDCAEKHACGSEMLRPRVNSPREGVCGYVGPRGDVGW
ncbi:MAG TPA: hypothetical protein VEL31_24015 [Ktedonobacteraceae bacterium]|nr:hypothetical protein [Ktedonobacteraceae bacterium]